MARVKDAVNLDPSHATDGLSLNVASEIMEGLVMFRPGTFDVTGSLATFVVDRAAAERAGRSACGPARGSPTARRPMPRR